MTHWNHRVFMSKYGKNKEFTQLSIREVFYNDDKSIFNYSGPITVEGETIEELRQTLEWCLTCLDDPILEEESIVITDTDDDLGEEHIEFDNLEDLLEDLLENLEEGDNENE